MNHAGVDEIYNLTVKSGDGPLRGRRSCDVRRRIPTSPANQVAGTWLVQPSYTDPQELQAPPTVVTSG